MKLAILSLALCLAAVSQSIHLHPSGTALVINQGTNSTVLDRRKLRIREHELTNQIGKLTLELTEVRLHMDLCDRLHVQDQPTPLPEDPPWPLDPMIKPHARVMINRVEIPMRHVATKE